VWGRPGLCASPDIVSAFGCRASDRRGEAQTGPGDFVAARLLGVNVRGYRELGAGKLAPDSVTWERLCELYGWP
jgi:hypothetical protein